jgi:hypothetical protein
MTIKVKKGQYRKTGINTIYRVLEVIDEDYCKIEVVQVDESKSLFQVGHIEKVWQWNVERDKVIDSIDYEVNEL